MVFSCLCCCHSSKKSLFFVCSNRRNLLNLKESSDRLVIIAKGFLKLPNLHMLIKQKRVYYFPETWLEGKSAIPSLVDSPEVLFSASHKAKLFTKNFSKNSNLDESGVSLPIFPSRTNLKLYKISVTLKMFIRAIANLDSSKVSDPDCIPLVALKNCQLLGLLS